MLLQTDNFRQKNLKAFVSEELKLYHKHKILIKLKNKKQQPQNYNTS